VSQKREGNELCGQTDKTQQLLQDSWKQYTYQTTSFFQIAFTFSN